MRLLLHRERASQSITGCVRLADRKHLKPRLRTGAFLYICNAGDHRFGKVGGNEFFGPRIIEGVMDQQAGERVRSSPTFSGDILS